MTHNEVHAYLDRGGNTIYIGMGAVEVHGAMPIDCEVILPEAIALEMAEQSDGLAMINLPYTYAGGTVISNATVKMSVKDGMEHLRLILYSLVEQGFRKIIFVSAHVPARITLDALCRDFFDDTKIHVCHISAMGMTMNREKGRSFDKMIYGAYHKLGQMEFLPVDPDAEPIQPPKRQGPPPWTNLSRRLKALGGNLSLIYEFPEDHFGGKPFASEEERRAACEEGLRQIHEAVSEIDLKGLLDAIDEYHDYVWNVALPKYPRVGKKYPG